MVGEEYKDRISGQIMLARFVFFLGGIKRLLYFIYRIWMDVVTELILGYNFLF